MALDFNNKIPEWKNKGTEPTDELKEKGFTGGYKPPATVFNWFWSLVQKCISELQTVVKSHADNTDNPHGVTKAQVGLGNVDNTADINKKVLSASKLTNAVKLNGITFDGTKDIEIPSTPKRTSLASDADLNEITAQGEYFASYGNTCINKPNSVKGFALKVYWNIVGSTSAITQVLYPSIGAIPMCFIRKGNSNGWADWQEVSTVGHTHTQADITDFNKPTPLKLLEDATEIDLNDIKTTGIYTSVTQTNYLHCPTTLVTDSSSKPNYAFSLLVLGSRVYGSKDTISYYTQICIDNFGGQGQNQTWIRTYYGNAGWTVWYSIYSAKNKPTLEDITGSTVLPVSKGGTGFSAISAGYALVGNGTSAQLGTRYINSSVEEKSNDIVTGGAVYNALEKFNTLSKSSYVVAASDSDEILKKYADYVCDGVKDEEEIQKAIDTSPVGSEIKLLAGHYNMNNPISINKQISLIGSGLNTVITSTRKTVDGLYLMHAIYINYNGKNVLSGVNISNFKLSRGLCSLNGKFYDGTGSIYTEEFPTYYRSQPLIELGDTDKLKLDYIQFFNKYTNENIDMIRCGSSDNSKEMIEASFILNDCFHSIYNEEFNGYFINFALNNSLSSASSIFVNGCACTGNLSINLPTQEHIKNTIVNSLKTKFYIKGVEE
ncbi:MAG: hypothetical protein ACLUE7_05385 [Lachnospirales bacterium]